MPYRYPRHRIQEMVAAPKCVTEGQTLDVVSDGEHGAKFDVNLDLVDGPYTDLRYLGRAGRADMPETYDCSLLLDQQRVRGIGYCPVARHNFRAKLRIPAGWHQNVCDPNVATNHPEWKRHDALPGFAPTDFSDFIRKAGVLWNIDLGWEAALL